LENGNGLRAAAAKAITGHSVAKSADDDVIKVNRPPPPPVEEEIGLISQLKQYGIKIYNALKQALNGPA
jgi:hypothetical protein